MRLVGVLFFLVGVVLGWIADWYLMALGSFGFWLGLVGVLLCTATVIGAAWAAAAFAGEMVSFSGPSARGIGIVQTFNGFVLGGALAVGWVIGYVGLGSIWLGLLFAALLAVVALLAAGAVARRRIGEDMRTADMLRHSSRPPRFGVDGRGNPYIY